MAQILLVDVYVTIHGSHHDLHSFPTRRSSDLGGLLVTLGTSSFFPAEFGVVRAASTRGARDRKSTRLNSSHTVISYAVFCLKKKKVRDLYCVSIPPCNTMNV